MSFSQNIKNEILSYNIENQCCKIAFLTGLIKTISELNLSSGKINLEFKTDNKNLLEYISKLIEEIYNYKGTIEIDDDFVVSKHEKYILKLDNTTTLNLLKDCELMNNKNEINELNYALNYTHENDCCKRYYIIAIFLGCGTTNIVLKSIDPLVKHSGGYHLEFVFNNEAMATDMQALLKEIDINAKTTIRKKQYIVYIKEAEQVSDMIAFLGASNCVLQLQNEIAIRQVRNAVNRQNNCMSGNINKTIDASMRQIECIQLIDEKVGITSLDDDLAELCLLRLANPEEPLVTLIKLYSKPISKSGINYRFSKIEKIALSLLDI